MAKETRAEDGPLMDGHKFLRATKRLAFRNDFFHFSHRFALSGGLWWWTCSDSPNFVFETLRNLAICSACRASWWQSWSSNLGLFPNPVFAVLYHTGKPSCCSLWALNKYWISKSSLFASDCWLSLSSHIYFNWKPLPLDGYSAAYGKWVGGCVPALLDSGTHCHKSMAKVALQGEHIPFIKYPQGSSSKWFDNVSLILMIPLWDNNNIIIMFKWRTVAKQTASQSLFRIG